MHTARTISQSLAGQPDLSICPGGIRERQCLEPPCLQHQILIYLEESERCLTKYREAYQALEAERRRLPYEQIWKFFDEIDPQQRE